MTATARTWERALGVVAGVVGIAAAVWQLPGLVDRAQATRTVKAGCGAYGPSVLEVATLTVVVTLVVVGAVAAELHTRARGGSR